MTIIHLYSQMAHSRVLASSFVVQLPADGMRLLKGKRAVSDEGFEFLYEKGLYRRRQGFEP